MIALDDKKADTSHTTPWTSKVDFPPFVQPMPQIFHRRNIIYSTRYQQDNQHQSGIFEYDPLTDSHSTLELWSNCEYFPRWNIMTYSAIRETVIFVGGVNVKEKNYNYNTIICYKMQNGLIVNGYVRRLNVSIPTKLIQIILSFYRRNTGGSHGEIYRLDIQYTIGANCKLLLTHNDDYLHIIGGTENNEHILYDLNTFKSTIIRTFNPNMSEQGIFHIQSLNSIIMFGGFCYANHMAANQRFFDDFWMLDLNEYISLLPMQKLTQYLVYGYVRNILLMLHTFAIGYDVAINEIIELYLANDEDRISYSEWRNINKYKMKGKLHGFGSVLYNDRIIIIFGGKIEGNNKKDTIYYIDLNGSDCGDDGWIKSEIKCPNAGSCNAVLMEDGIIHILPYSSYTGHWWINVKDLLPETLIFNELY